MASVGHKSISVNEIWAGFWRMSKNQSNRQSRKNKRYIVITLQKATTVLSLDLSKVGPHLWNRPTSGTLRRKEVHESRGHTSLVLCLISSQETCIYSFIYSLLQWLTFMLNHQHPIRFSIPSENVSKCVIHCLGSLKMIEMNGFVALGVNLHFSGKLSYAVLISSQC